MMKSLKGFRGLILGLIIGVLLATVGTAFADSSVTGIFSEFHYLVNGKAETIASTPIVVNGKTYLPTRDIATLLNYNVEYDSTTKTIGLSNDGKQYLIKGNDVKVSTTTTNVSSQGFVYEKLPITKTINGVTLTINSITVLEDKTAFDLTVKNDNVYSIKIDTERGIKTDMEVTGKTSENVNFYNGNVMLQEGMIDFRKTAIRAGETKKGIVYQGKMSRDVERINFFPSSHEAIADFSFYIDTKGSL